MHVNENCFFIGSSVIVKTTLSNEEIFGEISVITPSEVIMKLQIGTRIRFYVEQIRDRSVHIELDLDENYESALISEAANIIGKRSR